MKLLVASGGSVRNLAFHPRKLWDRSTIADVAVTLTKEEVVVNPNSATHGGRLKVIQPEIISLV